MLFKHDYQITYYSNDQTLTSSNIYPRNLSTQCIVYLQSLQLCNFESWFCIKGSNTDPTHLLWLLSTESGPHFSNESQNQAFEIMITISYDNLCFYNRFPVCFVCQVCLSRYGLFFFWQICFFVCVVIQQIPWNGKHFFTSLHRLSLLRKRVSSSSLYEMNWRNSYVPSFRGGGGGVGEGVPMGQFSI